MNNKNIKPFNDKGQPHGYWEIYTSDGMLDYKGNYINGKLYGYSEQYLTKGYLSYKGYYINNVPSGYWEWYIFNTNIIKVKEYIIL